MHSASNCLRFTLKERRFEEVRKSMRDALNLAINHFRAKAKREKGQVVEITVGRACEIEAGERFSRHSAGSASLSEGSPAAKQSSNIRTEMDRRSST